MKPPSVAVIDIGSNSIKVLVAARDKAGVITALKSRTIDARISAGISRAEPRLTEEGMARGLEAITSLLADAAAQMANNQLRRLVVTDERGQLAGILSLDRKSVV